MNLRPYYFLIGLIGSSLSYTTLAENVADFPSRPIKIIVPVAAGGNVDIVARTVGNELTKILGQNVVIENRPSSASIVGTQLVAKASPDGYTLLAHSSTFFAGKAGLIITNIGTLQVREIGLKSFTGS